MAEAIRKGIYGKLVGIMSRSSVFLLQFFCNFYLSAYPESGSGKYSWDPLLHGDHVRFLCSRAALCGE